MRSKRISHIPRQLFRLQPRYILIISFILMAALFASAVFELNQTKQEIYHLMQEEAASLMEAISLSGANAIKAFAEIERLVEDKLFTVAYFVNRLEQQRKLTSKDLETIAAENDVYRINLFNAQGEKVNSSGEIVHTPDLAASGNYLLPILSGATDELAIGFKESRHAGEKRFAVAIRRERGGVIVVNVDAQEMLAFRKTIGVGRLMQDIGDYKGILYIVLQDRQGIILASRGISRMTSIASDSFLVRAFASDSLFARLSDYEGIKIFEFVQLFRLDEEPIGLFRIGLNAEHLDEASNRIKRRLIIMSLVMGFVVLIIINFVMINQSYRLVSNAYQRIQTYSKNILEHMADAVIAMGQDKRITLFNDAAARLFQVDANRVINRASHLVIPEKFTALEDSLQSGKIIRDDEQTLELNGRFVVLSVSTSVLKNEQGTIEAVFAVIKDLTEKRHLEESLQRKEKLTAMGQLASGVAHEIRNPLNAIGVIAQRFNYEFEPKEDAVEYRKLTQIVVTEVRRINDIIQQFLRFARPPQLNLQEIDLNALIEDLVLLIKPQAQAKQIKVIFKPGALPLIKIDPNLMKQALLNLLQNSIDAIVTAGIIEAKTSRQKPREILVEIGDNGPGMDDNTRSKMFNLYFTTKSTGTGLGLSLVHQIISQHNGQIDVESEPGKGTRFLVRLPI